MRRAFSRTAVSLGLLMSAAGAQAVDETYMGFQVAGFELDRQEIAQTLEPSAGIGRLGGSMGDMLLFEGRVGTGLSDDSQSSGADAVTVDVGYLVGGYGLLRANVSETLFPYLIAGATLVDLDATGAPGIAGSETSFSYGVGFDARVSQGLGFGIEYMRYVDGGDYNLDALSFGVTARF